MRTYEGTGNFWIPGNEEVKIPGTLEFDQESSGKLVLNGAFHEHSNDDPNNFRILGLADGKYVCLDDCFQTHWGSDNLLTFSQQFHVGRILIGKSYDKDEIQEFDRADVRLTNLEYWTSRMKMEIEAVFDEELKRYTEHKVSAPIPENVKVAKSWGAISIRDNVKWSGDRKIKASLQQEEYLTLEYASPVPLDEITRRVSNLQDLVSIALNRTAAFEEFRLSHPDFVFDEESSRRMPIQFIAPWIAQPAKESTKVLHQQDMLFTFEEIGEMEGIGLWMDTAEKFHSELGRVMNSRYRKGLFVDDKIMHCLAALESFHRKWSGVKNRSLKDRFLELADLAGDNFSHLVGRVDDWCEKAKNMRNNYAHHFDRKIHDNSSDAYYHGEVAYLLFVFCMLKVTPVHDSVFEHISHNPQFHWIRRELLSIHW